MILAPFCILSGFAFVKVITSAWENNNFNPGKSFSIETMGGVFAGILISVLTSGLIETYLLLLIITSLTIAYSVLTYYAINRSSKFIVKISFSLILCVVILSGPDRIIRQLLLPGIKVTETNDTPYGNITRGEYAGEQSIFYNQRLISYNDDAIEREEDIHYALLQRTGYEKIILISGSLESHLPEILKYPVKSITFIERDPELARLPVSKKELGSVNLIIENRDAFSYVRDIKDKADAALLLLPPPSTLSLNRFYTTEFFQYVKRLLTSGGIFLCSPGPGENYLNKEAVYLYSSIYNRLTEVFRFVKPVGGNKLYFIASDKELSVSFCSLVEERGMKNIYVSPDFLSDDLIEKKSGEITSLLDPDVRVNRSVFPVACFYFQNYDFSKNLGEKIPAVIIIILAFAAPVLSVRRRDILMYFSASALAGFEIIILLTIQLTIGNLYQFIGFILAAFMTGLAAGAGINQKFMNSISLKLKAFILLFFYVVIAIFYNYITDLKGIVFIVLLIITLVLIPSFMTGHLFRALTTASGNKGRSAGMTYSSDLAGSAMGFIFVTSITVPLLGIRSSIILLSVLILTGILFGTNRNKY